METFVIKLTVINVITVFNSLYPQLHDLHESAIWRQTLNDEDSVYSKVGQIELCE